MFRLLHVPTILPMALFSTCVIGPTINVYLRFDPLFSFSWQMYVLKSSQTSNSWILPVLMIYYIYLMPFPIFLLFLLSFCCHLICCVYLFAVLLWSVLFSPCFQFSGWNQTESKYAQLFCKYLHSCLFPRNRYKDNYNYITSLLPS